jgi:hypothetical protein
LRDFCFLHASVSPGWILPCSKVTGGVAAACASPNAAKQIQWVKVQPRHLRLRVFIARSPGDKFCTW